MAKAPLDVRSLARQHTAAAIASLAGIATNGKSESARVAACDVLLQRGWGKPQSSEGGDGQTGAALPCPRYDARYMKFETEAALAEQPRASYCIRRVRW